MKDGKGSPSANVVLVKEAEEVRTPLRLSSMPPQGW